MPIKHIMGTENEDTVLRLINENFASFSEVDAMNPVSYINGAEAVLVVQDGVGKKATPQQLVGDPYKSRVGHAENVAMDFTDFGKLDANLTTSTIVSGGTVPQEPFNARFGGTGAGVLNGVGVTGRPSLQLTTGSTVGGWVSVAHTDNPLIVLVAEVYDQRWHFNLSNAPGGGQEFTARIGFVQLSGTKTDILQGVHLECTAASANWQAIVKNAAGSTPVDTGIPVTAAATTVRVIHNKTGLKSQFFIGGVELPPILHATRQPDVFTFFSMVCSIEKTLGATARTLTAVAHKYKNSRVAIPHFSLD